MLADQWMDGCCLMDAYLITTNIGKDISGWTSFRHASGGAWKFYEQMLGGDASQLNHQVYLFYLIFVRSEDAKRRLCTCFLYKILSLSSFYTVFLLYDPTFRSFNLNPPPPRLQKKTTEVKSNFVKHISTNKKTAPQGIEVWQPFSEDSGDSALS